MKQAIDLYLICGFLGAGKTTFLKKLLTDFSDRKIGVIVNEFGDIGIDGVLIEKNGIQMVEINRGSIFCSCLKGGFVKTLIEFSKQEIDLLVIENSGMADPSSIHRLLGELGDRVRRPYCYKGAVCLVDAVSFLKQVRVLNAVTNQIRSSNFILINKTDLVEEDVLQKVQEKILEINPTAYLMQTSYGEVPEEILNRELSDSGYDGESSNRMETRPETCALECDSPVEIRDLHSFGNYFRGRVLRMKGIVRTVEGTYQLDVVNEQCEIKEVQLENDSLPRTRIVMIQEGINISPESFVQKWRELTGKEGVLYE